MPPSRRRRATSSSVAKATLSDLMLLVVLVLVLATSIQAVTSQSTTSNSDAPQAAPASAPDDDNYELDNFYCGDTFEAAKETCIKSCRSGLDTECPGMQRCFAATNCFNPIVPMTSNMQISLAGEMDRTMDGNEGGTFENTTQAFLKRLEEMGIDLDRVKITEQELGVQRRFRRARSMDGANDDGRRKAQTISSALDVTVIITGEYRPPPYQNLDVLVQDSINADGDTLIQDLKDAPTETDFFQKVDEIEAVAVEIITPEPTRTPTTSPTDVPSGQPSVNPSDVPSAVPFDMPSSIPSSHPTSNPSSSPSANPTSIPSSSPSESPSDEPSASPSAYPSTSPSIAPSDEPTLEPSYNPSSQPSRAFVQDLTTADPSILNGDNADAYTTGSFGVLFNVRTKSDSPTALIVSLDFYTRKTDAIPYEVWTREGTYDGHRGNFDGWTKVASGSVQGAGVDGYTTIPFDDFEPVHVLGGGGTRAFYLTLQSMDLRYTKGDGVGSDEIAHADTHELEIYEGEGVLTYPFSTNQYYFWKPRKFLGTVWYNRWPCYPYETQEWPCPSEAPSVSSHPTSNPSSSPSINPTATSSPTDVPSEAPSTNPTRVASDAPSGTPSRVFSAVPSTVPSGGPTTHPSEGPSETPSGRPSKITVEPSDVPTLSPSDVPSFSPTYTRRPTRPPSSITEEPSSIPTTTTRAPVITLSPTEAPTSSPTLDLTFYMILGISGVPTADVSMTADERESLEQVLSDVLEPQLSDVNVELDAVDVLLVSGSASATARVGGVGALGLEEEEEEEEGEVEENHDGADHILKGHGRRALEPSVVDATVAVKMQQSGLSKSVLKNLIENLVSTNEDDMIEALRSGPDEYFDDVSAIEVRMIDKLTSAPTLAPSKSVTSQLADTEPSDGEKEEGDGGGMGIGPIIGIAVGAWALLAMLSVAGISRKKQKKREKNGLKQIPNQKQRLKRYDSQQKELTLSSTRNISMSNAQGESDLDYEAGNAPPRLASQRTLRTNSMHDSMGSSSMDLRRQGGSRRLSCDDRSVGEDSQSGSNGCVLQKQASMKSYQSAKSRRSSQLHRQPSQQSFQSAASFKYSTDTEGYHEDEVPRMISSGVTTNISQESFHSTAASTRSINIEEDGNGEPHNVSSVSRHASRRSLLSAVSFSDSGGSLDLDSASHEPLDFGEHGSDDKTPHKRRRRTIDHMPLRRAASARLPRRASQESLPSKRMSRWASQASSYCSASSLNDSRSSPDVDGESQVGAFAVDVRPSQEMSSSARMSRAASHASLPTEGSSQSQRNITRYQSCRSMSSGNSDKERALALQDASEGKYETDLRRMPHIQLEPESAIGRRLAVRFSGGKFYGGVVKSYDNFTKKHRIVFDDGDMKDYNLRKKTVCWEKQKVPKKTTTPQPVQAPSEDVLARQASTRMIMADETLTLVEKRQVIKDLMESSNSMSLE